MTLNEKFDAYRVDHPEHRIFSRDDSENVNSANIEEYVRELLKDSKNRLGLSALSTNNPSAVLEVPSAVCVSSYLKI